MKYRVLFLALLFAAALRPHPEIAVVSAFDGQLALVCGPGEQPNRWLGAAALNELSRRGVDVVFELERQ